MRRAAPVLAIYPIALVVLTAVHLALPQRSGIAAISQIFAPHLFLIALLLVPFALARDTRPLRISLTVAVAVGVVRFGSEWVSLPATEGVGTPIEVVTWNLEVGSDAGRDLVGVLTATRADIVILQELTPDHVAVIEAADNLASRFPHRILQPSDDVFGIGLLAAFPVVSSEPLLEPAGLVAELDIGGPEPLVVISAHPPPPRYVLTASFPPRPTAFAPAARDEALGLLRERVDDTLAADRRFILLGDFNVAPTEPAYAELAAGLLDLHPEVGLGPGWTWRPRHVEAIPAGVLRIDYVFVGGGIQPVGSSTDCSHPGDHCIVSTRVVVIPPADD